MKARSQSSSTPTKHSKRNSVPHIQRKKWNCARALRELRSLGEQRNIDGMARYGIRAKVVYGVAKPKMDELARRIGRDHELALELWDTGVHDARILAGMIDVAEHVSKWIAGYMISITGMCATVRAATCLFLRNPLGRRQSHGADVTKNSSSGRGLRSWRILLIETRRPRMQSFRGYCR